MQQCLCLPPRHVAMVPPLTGGVRAVERVLEVDDGAIAVLKHPVLLRVVLH